MYNKSNEINALLKMCEGEDFDSFKKSEIISDYYNDLQLLYIYYYVQYYYGGKDFYLYYKRFTDSNNVIMDSFVVILDSYTARYIEMRDSITEYYNTDNIELASIRIKSLLGK